MKIIVIITLCICIVSVLVAGLCKILHLYELISYNKYDRMFNACMAVFMSMLGCYLMEMFICLALLLSM